VRFRVSQKNSVQIGFSASAALFYPVKRSLLFFIVATPRLVAPGWSAEREQDFAGGAE